MKFLIVVDMQKDFIDGALGSPEAQAIVGKVKEKIQQYKDNGDVVIYTMDTHTDDYLDTMEGKKLPVKHCIKGTGGWYIDESLGVDYENDYIVEKPTFGILTMGDLFGQAYGDYVQSHLPNDYKDGDEINYPEVDQFEFVGLCTDICVISNVLIAKATFQVPIVVDASCCAGVTPDKHKAAIEVMKSCLVDVINEEQ